MAFQEAILCLTIGPSLASPRQRRHFARHAPWLPYGLYHSRQRETGKTALAQKRVIDCALTVVYNLGWSANCGDTRTDLNDSACMDVLIALFPVKSCGLESYACFILPPMYVLAYKWHYTLPRFPCHIPSSDCSYCQYESLLGAEHCCPICSACV